MENNFTVLIIEDNSMNLEMAKDLLQLSGFHTLEADDADTGIQIATEEHPDLILMDLHLPGKNGYEASKQLKSDSKTQDIPIIAFTAMARPEECVKAIHSGCLGIINKPIDVDCFSEKIKSFILNSL